MSMPEFDEIKVPALQFFSDSKSHKFPEVYEVLAKHFKLTPEEQNELLPSGTQRRWHNRANWACYDLFRAGLLDRPRRGLYVITEAGKKVAESKPKIIDRDFLMQFPQFVEFVNATGNKKSVADTGKPTNEPTESKTPQELIDSAYGTLNASLKKDLLDLLKQIDPFRFQQVVLDLLYAMGYGKFREEAPQTPKKGADEGIDGVINEDKLGLEGIYVQAKRWQQTVGRQDIQGFVGALAGQQAAHKGVFITTSDFADTAVRYAKGLSQKVILINGDQLADLMIQHNIGVSVAHTYEIKRIDGDYFEQD
jgi:restriction system protein